VDEFGDEHLGAAGLGERKFEGKGDFHLGLAGRIWNVRQ
jgi:hypothetical protein